MRSILYKEQKMSILRDYQAEGFDRILKEWEEWQLLMYMLATGGGKTVLFVEIIKHFLLQGKRIMLIAHREELINQAWQTLYRNSVYAGIIKAEVPPKY